MLNDLLVNLLIFLFQVRFIPSTMKIVLQLNDNEEFGLSFNIIRLSTMSNTVLQDLEINHLDVGKLPTNPKLN